VSPTALPYSLLLLLAEFCIGGQLFLFAADVRGAVTRGFVKMGAGLVAAGSACAFWVAIAVQQTSNVDGYVLSRRFFLPGRLGLAILLLLSLGYLLALLRGSRRMSLLLGALTSLTALLALAALAAIVQQPTWSFVGTFVSLLSGGLALGGVTLAMSLGHWYLVTPRLPEQPLNEMTLALLGIFALQLVVLGLNLAIPVRQQPATMTIAIAQNPAVWLRVGVGLLLPAVLGFLAWQASRMRGMMSATGLLYLATGAVLAGEALACSLLFTTAIPG
jgi:hypothetical protein